MNTKVYKATIITFTLKNGQSKRQRWLSGFIFSIRLQNLEQNTCSPSTIWPKLKPIHKIALGGPKSLLKFRPNRLLRHVTILILSMFQFGWIMPTNYAPFWKSVSALTFKNWGWTSSHKRNITLAENGSFMLIHLLQLITFILFVTALCRSYFWG